MGALKLERGRLKVGDRSRRTAEQYRLVLLLDGHTVDAATRAAHQAAEVVGALALVAVTTLVNLVLVRRQAGGVDAGAGELWICLCLAAVVREALLHAVVKPALAPATLALAKVVILDKAFLVAVVVVILHVPVALRHELVRTMLCHRAEVGVGRDRGPRGSHRTSRSWRRKGLLERGVFRWSFFRSLYYCGSWQSYLWRGCCGACTSVQSTHTGSDRWRSRAYRRRAYRRRLDGHSGWNRSLLIYRGSGRSLIGAILRYVVDGSARGGRRVGGGLETTRQPGDFRDSGQSRGALRSRDVLRHVSGDYFNRGSCKLRRLLRDPRKCRRVSLRRRFVRRRGPYWSRSCGLSYAGGRLQVDRRTTGCNVGERVASSGLDDLVGSSWWCGKIHDSTGMLRRRNGGFCDRLA